VGVARQGLPERGLEGGLLREEADGRAQQLDRLVVLLGFEHLQAAAVGVLRDLLGRRDLRLVQARVVFPPVLVAGEGVEGRGEVLEELFRLRLFRRVRETIGMALAGQLRVGAAHFGGAGRARHAEDLVVTRQC
jgi:hypothetical protein